MNESLLTFAVQGAVSTGEAILFWIVAPLVVLAALALVFARKAIYAAVGLVFVMIGLAAIYIAQDAVFLGVVQVVVYTGAIMMLFLFVLMLMGVDAAESAFETIRGQRALSAILAIGLIVGLGGIVLGAVLPASTGLEEANKGSNPVGVALVVFSSYPFAMQLTGALLIVAALSAMTLTHMDRVGPKVRQRNLADARMAGWQGEGVRITQLPPSGTFARSNRVSVPSIGPDGQEIAGSVPYVLRVRGQSESIVAVSPEAIARTLAPEPVGLTQMPGMPGMDAPDYAHTPPPPAIAAGAAGSETGKEEER